VSRGARRGPDRAPPERYGVVAPLRQVLPAGYGPSVWAMTMSCITAEEFKQGPASRSAVSSYADRVGDVYRDENEAALFAAARLREENEKLKRQVADLELAVKGANQTIGLARPAVESSGRRMGVLAGGVAFFLLIAGALAFGRAPRASRSEGNHPTAPRAYPGAAASPLNPNQPPAYVMPPSAGDTFDRVVAAATMGKAAGDASSCASPGGPGGVGRVTVTFEPDGTVSDAYIDKPPFAGTAVGDCVTRTFLQARVPAFRGSPVTLVKGFAIGSAAPARL
jgi:hypothetical protein